ncbi:MAG: carbohydrate kinase [Planctomycetaceae bacterium]
MQNENLSEETSKPLVVGLGELLWDEFGESRRSGGAPANVAFQANQLGCNGVICSRVGRDESGDEILKFLEERGLTTEYIQRDSDLPTGRVTVDDSSPGHPRFIIHENVAWDALAFTEPVRHLMHNARAVCFGTLAQRSPTSHETVQRCLTECDEGCLKLFDVNLRENWFTAEIIEASLQHANVLKLNSEEVQTLSHMFEIRHINEAEFCTKIAERFGISRVCVTRAERGCLLSDGKNFVEVPGENVQVVDAVGAGDALSAALILAVLEQRPLEPTARFINAIGANTTTRSGAMSSSSDEFRDIKQRILGE